MKKQIAVISMLALLAGLGGAGLSTQGAFAQSAPPAATTPAQTPMAKPDHPHWSASRHIEGRIAFLKAELGITPQQQAQWDKLAQVMRDNAKELDANFAQMHAQADTATHNAVQRIEAQGRFAALKVEQSGRLLAAFRPLYASLSDQQKQAADQLFGPHRHHHHGFR
ncbi:MAG: Spy/CpxP family protein refolding chaperone [Stellaceae bacterium]